MALLGEAQKNMFFQLKTLKFDQQSQKIPQNPKKYMKIQGFLGTPCGFLLWGWFINLALEPAGAIWRIFAGWVSILVAQV